MLAQLVGERFGTMVITMFNGTVGAMAIVSIGVMRCALVSSMIDANIFRTMVHTSA